MSDGPVDAVEDLYALPLAEFTAARNALAKSSGDKSIVKLKKPSAAAWALNQAARSHKGDVARFLHAAAQVRDGASRDEIDDMRAAEGDVRRAALRALGDRADAQLATINSLLAAAAADEAVGDVLRAGTLVGDEEADTAAFMFAPAKPATTKAKKADKGGKGANTDKTDKAAQKDELKAARERRAQEEARRREEERKAALKEAQAEADRLAREAAEAEEKAARLRERADRAQAKVEALRKT